MTDALVRGDPKAISELDRVIQERVLGNPSTPIVRVKVSDSSGRRALLERAPPDRRELRHEPV